jgi:hypothetical protein
MRNKDQLILEEKYEQILNEFNLSKLNPFKKKNADSVETEQPKQNSFYEDLKNFTSIVANSLQKKYPNIRVQDFAKSDLYHGDNYNSFAVYLNNKAILEIKPDEKRINDFKTENELSANYDRATYQILVHLEKAGIEFDEKTDYWRALHNPSALMPSSPWR